MNLINNTTIELVGYGHPDRFADAIAEKILTEAIKQDKDSKVAIEVLATRETITIGGEMTTKSNLDINKIVKDLLQEVYGDNVDKFLIDNINIVNQIKEQSPELNKIQNEGTKKWIDRSVAQDGSRPTTVQIPTIVFGDQGVVYGYYSKERYDLINNLYKWVEGLIKALRNENLNVWNDWKLLYNIETNELSISLCGIEQWYLDGLSFDKELSDKDVGKRGFYISNVITNPKGEWVIGGIWADTGVVGRKLMIDSFGAGVSHGGGAFNGKDITKGDKTCQLWASELAYNATEIYKVNECLVELIFKIGDERPKAYVYSLLNDKINKNKMDINMTLQEFVGFHNLKEEDWTKYSKRNNVIGWMEQQE